MDKALAYGARDSRFDPWQDRYFNKKRWQIILFFNHRKNMRRYYLELNNKNPKIVGKRSQVLLLDIDKND